MAHTARMDLMNTQAPSISVKEDETLAADERWHLVHRITASQQFAKATQLREILLYITRRSLLERATTISEQDIACGVLGRRGDFNPVDDNIVRVQMGHLRRKLELYFSTDGQNEPFTVLIPKGTYVPRFEVQSHPVFAEKLTIPPILEEKVAKIGDRFSTAKTWVISNKRYWRIPLAITFCAFFFFLLGQTSNRVFTQLKLKANNAQNPFLKRIFVSDLPVSIVVADTNLVVLQNVLHTDITIDQYISKNYPDNILDNASSPGERSVLAGLALRKFTSLADLNVAAKCVELSRDYGARTTIRYTRSMNARDFEKGNFILIGSRTADPWVEMFESQLNFAFERDPQTHAFYFRNKHPQNGEQEVYEPVTGSGISTISYVDVAIVPNLTKTGYVLLLNAATMDANEAAAELLFHEHLPPVLSKLFNSNSDIGNQAIEIFLRDSAVDGVVSSFGVVSMRKLP